MSDVYLRDLKESLQEDIKRSILKKRPELKEALDNEEDIVIGSYAKTEDYYSLG